ncbi:hypothetical protein EDD86DRAFT_277429 [Gorgonomyces haynaldii]|nr:hypothetical protein EDD86DRAFT_277429 [Gorgonomyces haynaldii]
MSREKGWNLMQQLPTELLYGIIKFLRVKSYLRLKRTCRRMDGLSGWRIAFDARDLFLAMDHAKVDIALQLLKMCDESDAAFQTMMPWAARLGHLDIVKHCLDDARVDPGAFDQYAVRIASEMGNDKMVRLLIENPRTDPSAEDDFCLYMATNGLHWETVKILLNDARVNPDVCDNYCLKMASEHGQIDIVRLLLKDERVDPSAQESYAVLAAYEHGHESLLFIC